MAEIIHWPFRVYFSVCGIIASLFVDPEFINFELVKMAVAIVLIVLFVMLAALRSQIIALFESGR
jgi:hypothetical protein